MVEVRHGIPERVAEAIMAARGEDPLSPVVVVTALNPRRLAHELALRHAWANVRIVVPDSSEVLAHGPHPRVLVGPLPAGFERRDDDVVIGWPSSAPPELRVSVAPDASVEVRVALAEVIRAHRAGTPWERLAIAWSNAEPYAALIGRVAASAGVSVNLPARLPVSQSAAGRAAIALCDVWAARFDRRSVAALWNAAPLLDPATGTLAPIESWDRASRRGRVISAPSWPRSLAPGLTEFVDRLRSLAPVSDDPNDVARALISSLLALVVGPRSPLGDEVYGAHASRETDAFDAVCRAVAVVAADSSVSAGSWRVALTDALVRRTVGGEGRIGEGVQCGTIEAVALGTFDLVVVVGASEAMDGRDDDRRARRVAALSALSALDAAPMLVTVPLADMRADREALPSPLLLSWLASRAGRSVDAGDLLMPRPLLHDVDRVASLWSTLVGEHALHLGPGELDLDDAWSFAAAGRDVAAHPAVAASPAAAAIRADRARHSTAFTEYDGAVTVTVTADWTPRTQSFTVTALERAATCPLRFFLDDVLGARPIVAPEDDAEPDGRHVGTMVHDALDDLTGQWLALDPATRDPFAIWLPAQATRTEQLVRSRVEAMVAEGVLVPGPDADAVGASVATRLRTHLRVTANDFDGGWVPYASEPRLMATIDTPGGALRLRGAPDRIDVNRAAGRLRIVDHKTGNLQGVAGAKFPDAIDDGTKVQLPLYALLALQQDSSLPATDIVGWYQHPLRPLGAMRRSEIQLRDEAGSGADLLERASAAVGRTLDAIEAGRFLARTGPRPGDDDHCRFCAQRAACPVDIVRETRAKHVSSSSASSPESGA